MKLIKITLFSVFGLFNLFFLFIVFVGCSAVILQGHQTDALLAISNILRGIGMLGIVTSCIQLSTECLQFIGPILPFLANPFWWISVVSFLFGAGATVAIFVVQSVTIRRKIDNYDRIITVWDPYREVHIEWEFPLFVNDDDEIPVWHSDYKRWILRKVEPVKFEEQ